MDKNFRDDIDFQVKLQGLANALGQSIIDALDATDAKLLAMLQKELKEIRRQLIIGKGSSTKIHARLESIEKQIGEIRRVGIKNALEIARGTAGYVADKTVKLTEEQIAALVAEAKAGREEEAKIRKRLQNSSLTAKEIDAIVKYQPFDGASIGQWFDKLQRTDLDRIFQEVQRGVVNGTSLAGIMARIRGTRDEKLAGVAGIVPGYDGALAISRKSARMLGRTVINGVANASRMEVYRKCADVIDGVKWLATLDSKTCPVCGALDGTIWPPDKLHEVKQPPAHPSCRCVLNPYIDLGPEFEATRAAAVENFDELAKKRYNAEQKAKKTPGKPWNKLTYETRQRKRNKEIRAYEDKHGEGSSHRQVKASETFEDYLKAATPEFRREYLGDRRAKAFENGTLKLDQMVSPDGGFVRGLESLEQGGLIPPIFKSQLGEKRNGWSDQFEEKIKRIQSYNSVKETEIQPSTIIALRESGFQSMEEFAEQVNNFVQDNKILSRFDLAETIDHLVHEPVLKNQFETGTSKGSTDLNARTMWERKTSGQKIDSTTFGDRERPRYGFLGTLESINSGVARGYGGCCVVVKDVVRERCTFTLGNSSGKQGAFTTDARAIFNKDRKKSIQNHNIAWSVREFVRIKPKGSYANYLETQVWGCIDLRKDVEKIILDDRTIKKIKDTDEFAVFRKMMQDVGVALVDQRGNDL